MAGDGDFNDDVLVIMGRALTRLTFRGLFRITTIKSEPGFFSDHEIRAKLKSA